MTLFRLCVSSRFENKKRRITWGRGEYVWKSPVSPNNPCKKNMRVRGQDEKSEFTLSLTHSHRRHQGFWRPHHISWWLDWKMMAHLQTVDTHYTVITDVVQIAETLDCDDHPESTTACLDTNRIHTSMCIFCMLFKTDLQLSRSKVKQKNLLCHSSMLQWIVCNQCSICVSLLAKERDFYWKFCWGVFFNLLIWQCAIFNSTAEY